MWPTDVNQILLDRFLDQIAADGAIVRNIMTATPLDVAVPSCPGWDLARLTGHLSRVHRMATAVVANNRMTPPAADELESVPTDSSALLDYFGRGLKALLETLGNADPLGTAWNMAGAPDRIMFWVRRQTHETAIHRVDAELAAGRTVTSVPADIAIDGVDEYLSLMGSRELPKRPEASLPGTVHLHATDAHGEWMIALTNAETAAANNAQRLLVTHGHSKGDAAIRGTASDLFLGVWGRLTLNSDQFEHFGDPAVRAAFVELGAF